MRPTISLELVSFALSVVIAFRSPLTARSVVSGHATGAVHEPLSGCPSADVIFERYVSAVGGDDAIRQIHTRVSDATESEPSSFNSGQRNTYKYSFKWKMPNRVIARDTHIVPIFFIPVRAGRATFTFDGTRWSDARGHPANEPRWGLQLAFNYPHEAMRRVAADPLMLTRPSAVYFDSEAVDDRSSNRRCVLRAFGQDGRTDMLYFDRQTGFLRTWDLQMLQPPLRSYTIRFQFDDYRQSGPVRFPFFLYCDFYKATFRFTKVTHNVPLRDSDFELKY